MTEGEVQNGKGRGDEERQTHALYSEGKNSRLDTKKWKQNTKLSQNEYTIKSKEKVDQSKDCGHVKATVQSQSCVWMSLMTAAAFRTNALKQQESIIF